VFFIDIGFISLGSVDMSRIDTAKSVIQEWANTLGISTDFCHIFEQKAGNDTRLIFSFTNRNINKHVLSGGVKDFGGSNLEKYTREDLDNFLFLNSLYLFANKYNELPMIKDIMDSGDSLYVTLQYYAGAQNTHLIKLFETAQCESKYNTYKIKKDKLKTYYLFFVDNEWN
jgi:hypothetical protein